MAFTSARSSTHLIRFIVVASATRASCSISARIMVSCPAARLRNEDTALVVKVWSFEARSRKLQVLQHNVSTNSLGAHAELRMVVA